MTRQATTLCETAHPTTGSAQAGTSLWWRRISAALVVFLLVASAADAKKGNRKSRKGEQTVAAAPLPQLAGPKRSVSVAPFSLKSDFEARYGSADLGGGLSAMLTTALIESDAFVVVERPDLGVVLSEQQLTTAGVVKTEGQAQVGQLLGAQLIIVGHVTEFSEEAKSSGFSFGVSLGGSRRRGFGLSPQKKVGTVGIDVRVLDASSGQVVTGYSVRESVKSKSIAASVQVDGYDLGNYKSKKTPIGEAARMAIRQVVHQLATELASRPWEGRVVEVEGNEVAINAGSVAGIAPGDRLAVYRIGKVLTDPVTGRVLGSRKRAVGSLVVTEVHENLAFAQLTAADGVPALRGDLVLTP